MEDNNKLKLAQSIIADQTNIIESYKLAFDKIQSIARITYVASSFDNTGHLELSDTEKIKKIIDIEPHTTVDLASFKRNVMDYKFGFKKQSSLDEHAYDNININNSGAVRSSFQEENDIKTDILDLENFNDLNPKENNI